MAKFMKIKRFSILLIIFMLFFPILISQINIVDSTLREKSNKNTYPTLSNNNVELEWNRTWGGIGQDSAMDIEIDSANNIYVTGGYDMATMGASAFLLKYNSSGGLEWSRTWQDTGLTRTSSIAFDSLNNIYLTGFTYMPMFTNPHIILLKYTSGGVLDWYREIGVGDMSEAAGITIDSSNNIYLSGSATFGMNTDVLLVKCDSSGFVQWSKTWDGGAGEGALEIVLDSSNNIYLSAGTNIPIGLPGNPNIALIKYNSSGDKQWHSIRDGGGFDLCKGISLDSAENIYLAGVTEIAGNAQLCLVKFDPSGQYQWNKTWGAAGDDMAMGIAIDSSDNIYLGGTSDIEVPLWHWHVGKISLVNYDSSGQYQWDHIRDETQKEGCFAVELDSTEENIYLAGLTENIGHNDTLLVKYKLSGASTNGDGKKDIPSYDIFLILIFTCFTLAYFIKKIRKEKK